jgi:hypothetical protein
MVERSCAVAREIVYSIGFVGSSPASTAFPVLAAPCGPSV